MKMLATVGALAIVGAAAVMLAFGADAPNRPLGVSAAEWAPISDTLGVVLVQRPVGPADFLPDRAGGSSGGAMGGAILSPPENGYFMVKHAGRWVRLVVIEPIKGPGDAG